MGNSPHTSHPNSACPDCEYVLDIYFIGDLTHIWTKKIDGSTNHYPLHYHPMIYVAADAADDQYTGDLDRSLPEIDQLVRSHPKVVSTKQVKRYLSSSHDHMEDVLQIMVYSPGCMTEVINDFKARGLNLYNIDLNPRQQFFLDSNVSPMMACHINISTDPVLDYVVADGGRIVASTSSHGDPTSIYYPIPPIRVMDIKVKIDQQQTFSQFSDTIISIDLIKRTFGQPGDTQASLTGDEATILCDFVEQIRLFDPDFLNVQQGDKFVMNYLAHRAAHHQLSKDFVLGRLDYPTYPRKEAEGQTYMSYGQIMRREAVWYLPGRVHIDAENSFFLYESGIAGLIDLARMSGVPLARTSRSSIGTALTGIEYKVNASTIPPTLVPPNKATGEQFKPADHLLISDNGGLIYPAIPGLYDRVWTIDFTSLYPMIMANHNIGNETVLCSHSSCKESHSVITVPEVGYHVCRKRIGVVPRTMFLVLQKRLLLKMSKREASDPLVRERYKGIDSAMKWILVSCLEGSTKVLVKKNGMCYRDRIDRVVNGYDPQDQLFAMGIDAFGAPEWKLVRDVVKIKPHTEVYRIQFQQGEVIATADHLWPVLTPTGWSTVSTDLLDTSSCIPQLRESSHDASWPSISSGILSLIEEVGVLCTIDTSNEMISKVDAIDIISQIKENSQNLTINAKHQLHLLDNLSHHPIGFSHVENIEVLPHFDDYVYCFTLDSPTPWFSIQDGLITHNCFGYLGFKNARWGSIESHQCVTAFARRYLMTARQICEDFGFEVIAGITDSLFIKARDPVHDNKNYIENLVGEISRVTSIPVDVEGCFQWVVFGSIRDFHEVGALNRYFGYFDHGEFKLRGIKHRQRRAIKLELQFQEEVLELFKQATTVEEFYQLIPQSHDILLRYIADLQSHQFPAQDLVMKLKSGRGAGGYKATSTVQALTVRRYEQLGMQLHAGMNFFFVVVDDSRRDIDRIRIGPEIDETTVYDPSYYITLLNKDYLELTEDAQYGAYGRVVYSADGIERSIDEFLPEPVEFDWSPMSAPGDTPNEEELKSQNSPKPQKSTLDDFF